MMYGWRGAHLLGLGVSQPRGSNVGRRGGGLLPRQVKSWDIPEAATHASTRPKRGKSFQNNGGKRMRPCRTPLLADSQEIRAGKERVKLERTCHFASSGLRRGQEKEGRSGQWNITPVRFLNAAGMCLAEARDTEGQKVLIIMGP